MIEIDIATYLMWIIATAVSVGVLVFFLFFTNKGKGFTLSRAISLINNIYEEYGDIIRERDEVFYDELREAIQVTNTVMEDGKLTWEEQIAVVKVYAPVFHRLFEIAKKKWKGSVMVIDTI